MKKVITEKKPVARKKVVEAQKQLDEQSRLASADNFQDQYLKIAKKAYELYERRGCQHGHDLEDWFQAQRLVEENL